MRRRSSASSWDSEAHLCEEFSSQLRRLSPEVALYPEVDEWDLLLVVPGDLAARWWLVDAGEDYRVAIEAKLRPGVPLLAQALYRMQRGRRRPDGVALLVPEPTRALREVCRALGFACWFPGMRNVYGRPSAPPRIESDHRPRIEPPRYDVPHLRAGAPAPRPLTKWREGSIRLCMRLRDRGYVTSGDFRELALSPRWWTGPGGVLVRDGEDERGRRRFVVAPGATLPDVGWEAVAEQIRAESVP